MTHEPRREGRESPGVNIENVRSLTINVAPSRTPSLRPAELGQSPKLTKRQRLLRTLNAASKIVSAVAGVAVASFAIMALLGYRQVVGLQIDALLTIVSVTFIGGIVSIGGVTILSLQASLRRQQRLIQTLQPQQEFNLEFLASHTLSKAWHHQSFPSRDLMLVYGHEHEARLYKIGREPSCLWKYGDGADLPVHFAQAAARQGDRLFALGDYSTGVVTLFDLATLRHHELHVFHSTIEYLEFSPSGEHLLVSPPVGRNQDTCAIINLRTRDIIRVPGRAPAVWLPSGELLLVSDKKTLSMYDTKTQYIRKLRDSHRPIVRVTAGSGGVAFAEESNRETELFLSDSDEFEPLSIGDIAAPVEQLHAVGDVLVVATSWNGHPTDAKRLRVIDRDGHMLSEVHYGSGYGHGYPKYSFASISESTWFCTTGANRIIRLFCPGRPSVKLDLRSEDTKVNPGERILSVQLTPVSERSVELSVLSEAGQMVLFSLDRATIVRDNGAA